MTDSVAQQQLRAFVDRILRMKEEAKAINDDIREIYAEAKGNGFDKTVLGKLVTYIEKRAKSADTLAEQDALFDLYLDAYDGKTFEEDERRSHTQAHAREEQPDADGVFERITEPGNGAGKAAVAPVAVASHSAPEADGEAVDAAAAPTGEVVPPISPEPDPVANVGEEANGTIAAASVDPASREVDEADRQQLAASGFTGDAEEGLHLAAASSAPIPGEGVAAGKSTGGSGVSPVAPVAPTHNPDTHFLNSKGLLRLHGCLNAEACASKRARETLCFTCSTQHDGPAYQAANEGRALH